MILLKEKMSYWSHSGATPEQTSQILFDRSSKMKAKWVCSNCIMSSTRRWNVERHIQRRHGGMGNPVATIMRIMISIWKHRIFILLLLIHIIYLL